MNSEVYSFHDIRSPAPVTGEEVKMSFGREDRQNRPENTPQNYPRFGPDASEFSHAGCVNSFRLIM